jgi:hypothetical protein
MRLFKHLFNAFFALLLAATLAEPQQLCQGVGFEPHPKWRHHPHFPFFQVFAFIIGACIKVVQ